MRQSIPPADLQLLDLNGSQKAKKNRKKVNATKQNANKQKEKPQTNRKGKQTERKSQTNRKDQTHTINQELLPAATNFSRDQNLCS